MALESERNRTVTDPLYAGYNVPYPICVGTVQAGTWASTVPESLILEGRYGVAVGESIADAQRLFGETIFRAAQADPWLEKHPPQIEWWGGQYAPASIPAHHPLVETVCDAYGDVSGTAPRVEGVTYGADMHLLIHEGNTPTVLFGPGDVRRAHREDEYVPVADLEAAVRTLCLVALRYCGYEGVP
jgi:acetylornithine deacetylase